MDLVLDYPQHKTISKKILALATNAKLDLDREITSFDRLFVVEPPTFVLNFTNVHAYGRG